MLCTLVLFSSCTNESTYSESTKNSSALAKKNVDDPKEQQKKLAELAYGLDQVYSLATQKIKATDTPNVVEILKESYTAIYKEYADEATFKDWSINYQKYTENAEKSPFASKVIPEIIQKSLSPEDAIKTMQNELDYNSDLTFEDRADFIAMQKTISFISDNNATFAKPKPTPAPKPKPAPEKGWWESWGKCGSSILGGAVTGAVTLGLQGAGVGTVVLPVVGTVSAGAVGAIGGAIGGALTGAVLGC